MYECACGFTAGTSLALARHELICPLKAVSSDAVASAEDVVNAPVATSFFSAFFKTPHNTKAESPPQDPPAEAPEKPTTPTASVSGNVPEPTDVSTPPNGREMARPPALADEDSELPTSVGVPEPSLSPTHTRREKVERVQEDGVLTRVYMQMRSMAFESLAQSADQKNAILDPVPEEGLPPAAAAASKLADDVEAVLMWHDVWHTTKVFGAGFYALLCIQQLADRAMPIRPSTVLLASVLALLGVSAARNAFRAVRGVEPPARKPREWALHEVLVRHIKHAAEVTAPVLAAVAVVMYRRTCSEGLYRLAWLASYLVLLLWAGEARLLSQCQLALVAYTSTFVLPPLYMQCKHVLDAILEELLSLVTIHFGLQNKAVVGSASVVALAVLIGVEAHIFVRLLLAAACAGGVAYVMGLQPTSASAGEGVQPSTLKSEGNSGPCTPPLDGADDSATPEAQSVGFDMRDLT